MRYRWLFGFLGAFSALATAAAADEAYKDVELPASLSDLQTIAYIGERQASDAWRVHLVSDRPCHPLMPCFETQANALRRLQPMRLKRALSDVTARARRLDVQPKGFALRTNVKKAQPNRLFGMLTKDRQRVIFAARIADDAKTAPVFWYAYCSSLKAENEFAFVHVGPAKPGQLNAVAKVLCDAAR